MGVGYHRPAGLLEEETMALEICTYTPALGGALEALQRRYIAANPNGSKFVPQEFYWDHPSMERGANVFCARDGGELVG